MTTNQKISLALLIGRAIVLYYMVRVVSKQYRVLKTKNYPELNQLRIRNLVFSAIILLGNIIPIIIDVMGIFGKGSFNLLLAYVFSNNITAIMSAYILWYNIRLAERIKIIDTEQARVDIQDAVEDERENNGTS